MKYLIAVPDNNYYIWQVLVQINNFKKYNLDNDLIYVIGKDPKKKLSDEFSNIIKSNKINAKFFIVDDNRTKKNYVSSLRPYILSKFFDENKIYDAIFYLDPDVVFTKKPDFSTLIDDSIWYVSDTISYIGAEYIKSKGNKLLTEMCDIVGVKRDKVIREQNNSGGAQYIMKNIPDGFWDKVYVDSEKLYEHMQNTSSIYSPHHPIQAWTADMWAVLWNIWYFGNKVRISKLLDFSWASDNIAKWDSCLIFHNAGVIENNGNHFSKIHYQKSPFKKQIICDSNSCSYNYVKEIRDTEKNYFDLIY